MQLDFSDIPTSIQTVEQLATWAIMVLQSQNPDAKSLESPSYSDFVAQVGIVSDPNGLPRFIGRLNLELAGDYQTATTKFWMSAKPISNMAIPTTYQS